MSELSEEGADQEAAGAEQADWCRLLRFPKVLQADRTPDHRLDVWQKMILHLRFRENLWTTPASY